LAEDSYKLELLEEAWRRKTGAVTLRKLGGLFFVVVQSTMGGGNGQKAKMAREKNIEKNKPSKGSQLETNKKAMNIQCKVCMQTFICTTSEVKCREHAEAKHPKADVYQCFPHLKK